MKTNEEKNQDLLEAFTPPMTPEEATEEILLGNSFTSCKACEGFGGSVFQDLVTVCDQCQGDGGFHRPSYIIACSVLKLALPKVISPLYRHLKQHFYLCYTEAARQQELQRAYRVSRRVDHTTTWKLSFKGKKLPSFFPAWAKQ